MPYSARQAKVFAPARHLSNATVVADSGSLLGFIGWGEPIRQGAVGSIGYCMGGQFVIRAAATSAMPAFSKSAELLYRASRARSVEKTGCRCELRCIGRRLGG
jgi:dienelactone hydrolase